MCQRRGSARTGVQWYVHIVFFVVRVERQSEMQKKRNSMEEFHASSGTIRDFEALSSMFLLYYLLWCLQFVDVVPSRLWYY